MITNSWLTDYLGSHLSLLVQDTIDSPFVPRLGELDYGARAAVRAAVSLCCLRILSWAQMARQSESAHASQRSGDQAANRQLRMQ